MTAAMAPPRTISVLFLRLALASGFLSAVADRVGLWGPLGEPGVVWGGFEPFLAYTGELLWYLPESLVPAAGVAATVGEVVLAIGLLSGIRQALFATASGILLTIFAVTMTITYGFETPLSYSVWAAAAGAFLLASVAATDESSRSPETRD